MSNLNILTKRTIKDISPSHKKRTEDTAIPRKEKTAIEKELDQVVEYLKAIHDEMDYHKEKDIKTNQQLFHQSFNSLSQKSLLIKAEENKIQNKINFNTLFSLEEKEPKADYSMKILRDEIENSALTNEEKICDLVDEMENYKDILLESSLCKTNEDRLALDLFLAMSRESFTLYSQKDKRMLNYFKTLREVKYPLNINDDLINVNNQYIFIEDISAQNEDTMAMTMTNIQEKKRNSANEVVIDDKDDIDIDYDYDYDDDDNKGDNSMQSYYSNSDSSNESNHIEHNKDNDEPNTNNSDSHSSHDNGNDSLDSDDICELEEVNVEIKNKFIFNEDNKKDTKIKIQPNDSIFIPNDPHFTQTKKHMDKLRQIGFDNMITIIHTDKHQLPFGLSNVSFDELTRYIANIENSKMEKDLFVFINEGNNRSTDSARTYTEGDEDQKRKKVNCNKYFKQRFIQSSEIDFEEKYTIHEELNKSHLNENQMKRLKIKNKYSLQ